MTCSKVIQLSNTSQPSTRASEALIQRSATSDQCRIGEDKKKQLEMCTTRLPSGFYEEEKENLGVRYESHDPNLQKGMADALIPKAGVCYPIISDISATHVTQPGDFFYKIPKLLGPSSSSLNTRPTTPLTALDSEVIGCTEEGYHPNTIIALQSPDSPEINSVPVVDLGGRDRSRVFLDCSSSYYTSDASSVKSSIDLTLTPVPPIPHSIFAKKFSAQSPASHPQPAKTVASCVLDIGPNKVIGSRVPTSSTTYHNPNEGSEHASYGDSLVGPSFIEKTAPIDINNSASDVHISQDSIKIKDPGSSIWGGESPRRPLLSESAADFVLLENKQWGLSSERLDKGWKVATHKKSQSNGTMVDDVKGWLDEQRNINTLRRSPVSERKSRSMTFKKTFTKSMSKLRNRLSANLRPTGSTTFTGPGPMKSVTIPRDGRGEFTRLPTPSESIATDRTTIIGEYINVLTQDITPNSERVMADITFSPSLPDGSLEEYDDFQVAELVDKEGAASESTTTDGGNDLTLPETPINHNRYSAIYEDCVLFPFLSDEDDCEGEDPEQELDSL